VVEVSVDGGKLKTRFDGFDERIIRSERIDCGRVTLTEGPHRLRFTAVAKDPRATHYHFAVDCLELLPEDGSPGEASWTSNDARKEP
jgi:hypothetical protein